MSEQTLMRHLILTQRRKKRNYNLWLMKNTIKCFLAMAAMVGIAMLTSLVANLIT